jgi:undecaprenyl-diphosphatase
MNMFEITLLDKIRDVFSSPFLDKVMPIITRLGDDGIFWIILAIIFLCFRKTRKMGFSSALAMLIGLIVVNVVLKNAVGRIRPYEVNPSVTLLVERLSDYSFPSGHTAVSFEAATAIFIRNKKLGIPSLILATLIAFSRLYLYVHYPTDVLAGFVIGVAIAILASFVVDKIYLKINKNKKTSS